MQEIWRKIKESCGIYSVSNFGRVRRDVGGVRGATAGRILRPSLVGRGYARVILHISEGEKIRYVHTLVLEAFVRSRQKGKIVNHIDGNKLNNCLSNLEWTTPSKNNKHAIDAGLRVPVSGKRHPLFGVSVSDPRHPMYGKIGTKNPAAKFTKEEVCEIRKMKASFTNKKIAEIFNVNRQTIADIVNGRTYQNIF